MTHDIPTSARSLLAALKDKRLSAVDLMSRTLDRIETVNPDLNAIVAMRSREDLMAEAQAVDAGPDRGALHGLPFAIKDTVNVAGMVSTQGSPKLAGFVPETDDLVAARIRRAGAIVIGKTNIPEFGLGSHSFNPVYGATRNPYASDRSCGGSSGGAAVALATGMVTLADGSDMMGSLRNPAAWNNVYGFRPTWGYVPSDPVGDLYLHQLATAGPMARSPDDIALLLDVLSGPASYAPYPIDAPKIGKVRPAPLDDVRIGWLSDWGGALPMEAGILDLCDTALAVFSDAKAGVERPAPPFSASAIWESWTTLRSWSVGVGLAPLREKTGAMKDSAEWEMARGLAFTGLDIQRASELRSDWFRAAMDAFQTYDVLALPSAQVWPFPIEQPYPTEIAGVQMDTYHRWMEVTLPVSLIGLPCLNVPAGFGPSGLPMGLQLFGPPASDRMLLEIGAAYHDATHWPEKRPPAT